METITRNLEELAAFHLVATEGSFTRAAETLGSSKAMVSKQVKRLESYMHAQLFHRTTRTLELTQEGKALLDYSQKIFDLSDEASKRLRDMSQGSSGTVRISAPISLGEIIFPDLLSQVKAALPLVKFELDVSNDSRDFAKDGIDFALRATSEHHPDLIARPLGQIRDVICASPKLLKKIKLGKNPKDLMNQKCILHTLSEDWNRWTFHSGEEDIQVEAKGDFATNQYPMIRLLCLQGMGIARIPLYLVADDFTKGDLVPLFSEYEIATHPLYLVYLKNEYATKKHQVVKDLLLRWFKENTEFFTLNQNAEAS